MFKAMRTGFLVFFPEVSTIEVCLHFFVSADTNAIFTVCQKH